MTTLELDPTRISTPCTCMCLHMHTRCQPDEHPDSAANNLCSRHDALCENSRRLHKQPPPPQKSAVAQSPNVHQHTSCTQHVPPPPLNRSAQLACRLHTGTALPTCGLNLNCGPLLTPSKRSLLAVHRHTVLPNIFATHCGAAVQKPSPKHTAGASWLRGPLCRCTRVKKTDETCQKRGQR